MKSKIKGVTSEYPKLMVIKEGEPNAGTVILMMANKKGVVVHSVGIHHIGHSSSYWIMADFEDFHGTIELSN